MYASLIGILHATKLARALEMDGALRLLSGGHRISAMAAVGVKTRFLVAVLVTADPHDYGLLEPIVAETEKMLSRAGVEDLAGLQIAADAGYCAQADLAFAERVRDRIDLLIDGVRKS